jgi:DNA polymerase III delta prime subunit
LFCGRPGTGKTTALLALYRNTLWIAANDGRFYGQYIWKVDAKQLSDEFHDWKTNGARADRETGPIVHPPTVTVNKIKEAKAYGFKPLVSRRNR